MVNCKNILIAPLDWGIGHSSRCVPIINQFLAQGHNVFVACNAWQQAFLQQEVIGVTYIPLEGYNINYGASAIGTALKLLLQIPKFFATIKKEHVWLHDIITQYHIHEVISDNRYGLYSAKVKSIFITHQLQLATPTWAKWVNTINIKLINKFTECWVPDVADGNISLAGNLSKTPSNISIPVIYKGWLSRWHTTLPFTGNNTNSILVILSGPEPQRSICMHLLLQHLPSNYTITIVGATNAITISKATIYTTVNKELLSSLVQQHKTIITRAGYSTIMDLAMWQRSAILIPTPAQPEQLYLATLPTILVKHKVVLQGDVKLIQHYIA